MEKTIIKDLGTKDEFMARVEKADQEHSLQVVRDKINFVDAFYSENGVGIPLEHFANYLISMNFDITPKRLLEWLFKNEWLKRSKHTKVPYVTDCGWDMIHVSNDWETLPNGSMHLHSEVAIMGEGQLEIVTKLLNENYPKMFLRNGDEFINLRKVRESKKTKSDN